jgi:hypothetical protein
LLWRFDGGRAEDRADRALLDEHRAAVVRQRLRTQAERDLARGAVPAAERSEDAHDIVVGELPAAVLAARHGGRVLAVEQQTTSSLPSITICGV